MNLAPNGNIAKSVGCRISFGTYVFGQVQGVDSRACYSFKAV